MGHPEEVLAYLADGNARYAAGGSAPRDYAVEREQTYEGQEPFAAVLACSDSRVPVEQIFDCGLGDLIVVRTAGHLLDDASRQTIAFAVQKLGVGAVVVLGHTDCAAVHEASGSAPPGSAADWIGGKVRSSLAAGVPADPRVAEREHAQATAARLSEIATVREAVDRSELAVAPAVYDLRTGVAEWL